MVMFRLTFFSTLASLWLAEFDPVLTNDSVTLSSARRARVLPTSRVQQKHKPHRSVFRSWRHDINTKAEPAAVIVSRRCVRTAEEQVLQDYVTIAANVAPQHPHLWFRH